MDEGIIKLRMAEMQVGKLDLQFEDKKTGDIRSYGKTKPEIILRQLSSKPGKVINPVQARQGNKPWQVLL